MRFPALVLCVAWAVPALAQSSAPGREADDAAVREVVRKYMDARDLQDPKAIEALFTADADQYTTGGEWRRGRGQVVPGTLESSKRNPGDRRIRIQAIRFVTADVAIADGPYEIGAAGASARRMWTTLVLTRGADGWRIAAIRNAAPTGPTRAAPEGANR